MRRQPIAFALVDAAFLADSKFRALARRLPDADDFNSAVGAWLIALADARRSASPAIDVAAVTGTRFVPDLVAVGLVTEVGFPPGPFAAWAPMSPQQAAAGKARADLADAAGLRDDRGRFLPTPAQPSGASALDTPHASDEDDHPRDSASVTQRAGALDQRGPAFPSPPINSDPENGVDSLDGDKAPETRAVVWLAQHGCYVKPGSGYHRHLVLATENHGIEAVLAMLVQLEAAGTKRGDVKGYVFGAKDGLDGLTRPKDPAGLGRDAAAVEASRRRTRATKAAIEALKAIQVPDKPYGELVPRQEALP